jgi:hypothetical protein
VGSWLLIVPGHAPGQIIVSDQDIREPIMSSPENLSEQPGYRASLYDTVWPVDKADLNRSNSVVDAGLPRDVTAAEIAIESVEMPFPVFAYTRDEDEVFVIGGTSWGIGLEMTGLEDAICHICHQKWRSCHLTEYVNSDSFLHKS